MRYNILEDYKEKMVGEGPFYTDYLSNLQEEGEKVGLEYVNWGNYQYLNLKKTDLIKRFNNEYAYREIGQETTNRFQFFLQNRYDEVAEHYDHMYKVFAENNVDIVGTGYDYEEILNQDKTSRDEGTVTDKNDNRFEDTPSTLESTINNPTNRTTDTGESKSNSSGTAHNEYLKNIKRTDHKDTMIDEVNSLADKYRSIDNEFIKEFENMFIGIW